MRKEPILKFAFNMCLHEAIDTIGIVSTLIVLSS